MVVESLSTIKHQEPSATKNFAPGTRPVNDFPTHVTTREFWEFYLPLLGGPGKERRESARKLGTSQRGGTFDLVIDPPPPYNPRRYQNQRKKDEERNTKPRPKSKRNTTYRLSHARLFEIHIQTAIRRPGDIAYLAEPLESRKKKQVSVNSQFHIINPQFRTSANARYRG
jgi:hypothetical protein